MAEKNESYLSGLAHIGLFIRDLDRSVAFYEALGFQMDVRYHRPNGVKIAFMSAGSCKLELIQPTDPARIGRPAGIIDHICIEVSDIEAAVARLKELSVTLLGEIEIMSDMFDGVKNIFFTGPDGERLEYFEYPKK